MDDWFISFVVFVVAFVLYFHVQNQYKTSDILEIYETDYTNHKTLQDTCSLKQPVLFSYPQPGITLDEIESVSNYVYIKDIREFYQPDTSFVEPIVLHTTSGLGLLSTDTRSSYFSEHNPIQIEHNEKITDLDHAFKPFLTVQTEVDVLFGSRKAYTPMTYHNKSQRFFVVQGNTANCGIRIKMCPWKNTAKLNTRKNYEHMQHWSTLNMFRGEDHSLKILDFVVNPGYVLFIPPYWWYSFQYLDKTSCVTSITYSTAVNLLANAKEYALHMYRQPNLSSQVWNHFVPDLSNVSNSDSNHPNDPPPNDLDTSEVKSNNGQYVHDSVKVEQSLLDDEKEKEKEPNQEVSLQLIEELKSSSKV